jgi:hypothetical protein
LLFLGFLKGLERKTVDFVVLVLVTTTITISNVLSFEALPFLFLGPLKGFE